MAQPPPTRPFVSGIHPTRPAAVADHTGMRPMRQGRFFSRGRTFDPHRERSGRSTRNHPLSRGARIRTLCTRIGSSLLSQEHTPVDSNGAGCSAEIEPGVSRFTVSYAATTPRTPSTRLVRGGRGGSRTRKAHRSPALQAGPVSNRVALPSREHLPNQWSRVDSNHRSSPRQRDVFAARRRDPTISVDQPCPGQDSNPEHLVRSEA
jgi:hypothetical protein